jgi:aspartate aminotransferase
MAARRLSRRADTIKPSPTLAMNKRAAELQRQGRDIIALSLAEPDFHTPDTIKSAGIAAIDCNFTKYTAPDGCAELKAAIVRKLRRENSLEFGPRQIVVSSGAKIAILAALLSAVDPGDEVVIPAPYWVSYPDLVSLAEGVSVPAHTTEQTASSLQPNCSSPRSAPEREC